MVRGLHYYHIIHLLGTLARTTILEEVPEALPYAQLRLHVHLEALDPLLRDQPVPLLLVPAVDAFRAEGVAVGGVMSPFTIRPRYQMRLRLQLIWLQIVWGAVPKAHPDRPEADLAIALIVQAPHKALKVPVPQLPFIQVLDLVGFLVEV